MPLNMDGPWSGPVRTGPLFAPTAPDHGPDRPMSIVDWTEQDQDHGPVRGPWNGPWSLNRTLATLGKTALEIADETRQRDDLDENVRVEMEKIVTYLEDPWLPVGEEYVFPCMDPDYCNVCCSLRCTCPENDVPGMPGSFT